MREPPGRLPPIYRTPPLLKNRFWTMLAHWHGSESYALAPRIRALPAALLARELGPLRD